MSKPLVSWICCLVTLVSALVGLGVAVHATATARGEARTPFGPAETAVLNAVALPALILDRAARCPGHPPPGLPEQGGEGLGEGPVDTRGVDGALDRQPVGQRHDEEGSGPASPP